MSHTANIVRLSTLYLLTVTMKRFVEVIMMLKMQGGTLRQRIDVQKYWK